MTVDMEGFFTAVLGVDRVSYVYVPYAVIPYSCLAALCKFVHSVSIPSSEGWVHSL